MKNINHNFEEKVGNVRLDAGSTVMLIVNSSSGKISTATIEKAAWAFPAVVASIFVGKWIGDRISQKVFLTIIEDLTYFTNDGDTYASFTTTSFSEFVFVADVDDIIVASTSVSSSNGSGTALDTHAPVITVDGEIATVYDANLKIITIDSNEYTFDGNTVVIDLSQFGDGTYKIYAADKYGRYATETVTVSSVKIAETVVAVEDEPEEVPVVAEAKEESSFNFPWWILIVIAVCTATYIVYKKQKNKKENQ